MVVVGVVMIVFAHQIDWFSSFWFSFFSFVVVVVVIVVLLF